MRVEEGGATYPRQHHRLLLERRRKPLFNICAISLNAESRLVWKGGRVSDTAKYALFSFTRGLRLQAHIQDARKGFHRGRIGL
jgi:hypothetical protein